MERAHRRRLSLLFLLIAVPLVVLAPWAYASTMSHDVPTITFTATGTPPLACGSRPNVTSLTIEAGTTIMIANLTGVDATIDVGWQKLLDLDNGMEALVRLSRGQHVLLLVPHCVIVSDSTAAVVSVLTEAQMSALPSSSPTGGAPGSPVTIGVTSSGAAGDRTGTPAASGSVSSTPDPGSTAGAVATGPSTRAQPPVLEGQSDDLTGTAEVLEIEAIDIGGNDPKGFRLLATIATICVLGVTAAIIRAIVSERTTGTVG